MIYVITCAIQPIGLQWTCFVIQNKILGAKLKENKDKLVWF